MDVNKTPKNWGEIQDEISKNARGVFVNNAFYDMVGDHNSARLLAQIFYWFSHNKTHRNMRVKIKKEGRMWLCKSLKDWWDEIRLTKIQVRRSINILLDLNLIQTKKFMFYNSMTTHIHLNTGEFYRQYCQVLQSVQADENDENMDALDLIDEIEVDGQGIKTVPWGDQNSTLGGSKQYVGGIKTVPSIPETTQRVHKKSTSESSGRFTIGNNLVNNNKDLSLLRKSTEATNSDSLLVITNKQIQSKRVTYEHINELLRMKKSITKIAGNKNVKDKVAKASKEAENSISLLRQEDREFDCLCGIMDFLEEHYPSRLKLVESSYNSFDGKKRALVKNLVDNNIPPVNYMQWVLKQKLKTFSLNYILAGGLVEGYLNAQSEASPTQAVTSKGETDAEYWKRMKAELEARKNSEVG